jgi:hypothetical protein
MITEVMEVKAVSLYVSKKPIEVEKPIPLPEHRHDDMIGSFQCSVKMLTSRKILRWMTLGDRRHSRFMKQIVLLKRNPKHHEAIFRCLRYGNKIPRKYQRKYKEVIKQMKMPWQR